jgi:hypothetical protein
MKIKFYFLYSLLVICVLSFAILVFAYSSQKVEVDYLFKVPLKWDDFSSKWNGERLVNSKFYLGNVTFSTQGVFEKNKEFPFLIGCIKKLDTSLGESFYSDSISISFNNINDFSLEDSLFEKTYYSNQIISVDSLNNVTLNMFGIYSPGYGNNEFYEDKIFSIVILKLDKKEKSPFSFQVLNGYPKFSCSDLIQEAEKIIEIPIL